MTKIRNEQVRNLEVSVYTDLIHIQVQDEVYFCKDFESKL